MRLCITFLVLSCAAAYGQDAAMQASQQATQMASQAAQQANDQMMQASQQAMQDNQQAANLASQGCCVLAAKPKFSVKAGKYSSAITVRMKDSTRRSTIYYTTDGWTPTTASTRYAGPITISSTTLLQAIAVSSYTSRSLVATAAYVLPGVPVAAAPGPAPYVIPSTGAVMVPKGTKVPLVFAAEVSSKTAQVGDKISLALAEDLKAGDVMVAPKGTPATATVTQVDKHGALGLPGDLTFEVNSLLMNGRVIQLSGTESKEGHDKVSKAFGLFFIPGGVAALAVHGDQAEIDKGTPLTALVAADTTLTP
jgi:hypothetical protein